MKTFLKGFCIGLLCLSLLGLAWFLVLQPGLTNGEEMCIRDRKETVMKNLKRVLSLMMAVLLCFGLFPGSALAAENDYDGYLAMIEYKDRR